MSDSCRAAWAMAAALALLGMARGAVAEDMVEKVSGQKIRGEVVGQTEEKVTIKVKMRRSGGVEMSFKMKDVHAITVDGERKVYNEKKTPTRRTPTARSRRTRTPADGGGSAPAARSTGNSRTRAEVLALIEKAGTTKPDWWGSAQLNYPKTLDLSFPDKPGGPWNTRKNVGQYMFSIVNENPGRWKDGTKFMHFVLSQNKGNANVEKKVAGQLGHCYHDLLEDWARGAYWWQKQNSNNMGVYVGLADCYWKLGNKDMAVRKLSVIPADVTRYGSVIKLWSDMGELDRALKLAGASVVAYGGRANGAYMGAGDACVKHGKYQRAIGYYQKVLGMPMKPKDGILKKNKARAADAIKFIRVFETLDIAKVKDGSYDGKAVAYGGDLRLTVTVRGGRIITVRINSHKDKQYFSSINDTPRRIVEKQSLKGVDATTGATVTSQGIINATADALSRGMN